VAFENVHPLLIFYRTSVSLFWGGLEFLLVLELHLATGKNRYSSKNRTLSKMRLAFFQMRLAFFEMQATFGPSVSRILEKARRILERTLAV